MLFARRCFFVNQGSFTATHKYAVLLGLMDFCVEHVLQVAEPPQSDGLLDFLESRDRTRRIQAVVSQDRRA